MKVKEWQGEVVFLHEVGEGAADRSYGIHVARLAGLPPAVLDRAEEVLHRLEQGEAKAAPAALADDLPLFQAAATRSSAAARGSVTLNGAEPEPERSSAVEEALRNVVPDDLTPKAALDLVYRLRGLLADGGH